MKKNKKWELNLGEEDKLSKELKTICDKDGKELYPKKSAKIFHQLAKVYQKRRPELITHRMICLVKSAALFNAAIVRSDNSQNIENDLKDLCTQILHEAGAIQKDADLIEHANVVAAEIKKMRDKVEEKLKTLTKIPDDIQPIDQESFEAEKITEVEELLNGIANEYKNVMVGVAKFAKVVMGVPPCEFSLAAMGSLARTEITPYSDFENMILLEHKCREYQHFLNYFRWYSVIFQIVLINLKETIIPSMSIHSLNGKNSIHGDWFYDNITTCGICFDGMMPHACKFPLGRQQLTEDKPWSTELIKPVNEMLKYLNSKESLKNGYHLSTILTKTCYVYGNVEVYKQFEKGVLNLIEKEKYETLEKSVRKQMADDIQKFSTRQSLSNIKPTMQFNVKQVMYRSTAILISELGRLHKIQAISCFEILRELADNNCIDAKTKQRLMFAVALACEVRQKWYMQNKRQSDTIDSIDTLANLIGKQATISYFRIAYALQCDLSKRLKLKKFHLYSNPILLNISLLYCLNDYVKLEEILLSAKENQSISKTERYLDFNQCLNSMEKQESLNLLRSEQDQGNKLATFLSSLGIFLKQLNCFDDAIDCYQKALKFLSYKEKDIFKINSAKLASSDIARCSKIAFILTEIGGCLLFQETRFEDAKNCFENSLLINEKLSLDAATDRHVAVSLHEIGCCLTFMNKMDEAMVYLKKSLKVFEQSSLDISTDESIADVMHEIGRCLGNKNQCRKAIHYLQRSLQIREKQSLDFEADSKVAGTLQVAGVCFYKMNHLKVAIEYFEKTLQIKSNISSDVTIDVQVAESNYWIGRCLFDKKKIKEAKVFFQRVLHAQSWSSLDVTTDRIFASTTYWMGRCLISMVQGEKAKEFFERALEIETQLSRDITSDCKRANLFQWIGDCWYNMKKLDKACSCFTKALRIYEKLSLNTTTDLFVADSTYWIGHCLLDSNKLIEATFFFKNTLKIREKSSFEITTDCKVADLTYDIGFCILIRSKPKDAIVCLKRALDTHQKISLDNDFDRCCGNTLHTIGRCCFDMSQLKKAKLYFERSLEINLKSSMDTTADSVIADSQFYIGTCLLQLQNPQKAKDYFEKSFQIDLKLSSIDPSTYNVSRTQSMICRCLSEISGKKPVA